MWLSSKKGHILGIPKPKANKSERIRAGQHTVRGTETFAQNPPVKLFDLSLDQECRAELQASPVTVLEKHMYKSSLIHQVTQRKKHPSALRAVWLLNYALTGLSSCTRYEMWWLLPGQCHKPTAAI